MLIYFNLKRIQFNAILWFQTHRMLENIQWCSKFWDTSKKWNFERSSTTGCNGHNISQHFLPLWSLPKQYFHSTTRLQCFVWKNKFGNNFCKAPPPKLRLNTEWYHLTAVPLDFAFNNPATISVQLGWYLETGGPKAYQNNIHSTPKILMVLTDGFQHFKPKINQSISMLGK